MKRKKFNQNGKNIEKSKIEKGKYSSLEDRLAAPCLNTAKEYHGC